MQFEVVILEPGSPEAKAMDARMEKAFAEARARAIAAGAKSFEGFYIGEDGRAYSIDAEDL